MKSTLESFWIFLTLICRLATCRYDLSNVASGIKLSANRQVLVTASNAFANMAVIIDPFTKNGALNQIRCNRRYNNSDMFVRSVAVIEIHDETEAKTKVKFAFAAELMSTSMPFVCINTLEISTCASQAVCTDLPIPSSFEEYFIVAVDSNSEYLYGLTRSFLFKLEIATNEMIDFLQTKSVWPDLDLIPRAMELDELWGITVGYGYSDPLVPYYKTLGCVMNLTHLHQSRCMNIVEESTYLPEQDLLEYNDLYELSVSLRGKQILVGVHRLDMVVILTYENETFHVARNPSVSYVGSFSFGRGVAWADDSTVAVLVAKSSQSSWSKSQIFFYNENSISMTSVLYTFPNNQQIIGSRLSNPGFVRFVITVEGDLGLLLDSGDIVIVPKSDAGRVSTWAETSALTFVFYYEPQPCIGGTFKNASGLGPCIVCPPWTRNPGTSVASGLACTLCDSDGTHFCTLASLAEVNRSAVYSYTQATDYPDNPDTMDIDDILLQNVFHIGSDPTCFVISPLFWTIIIGSVCIIIWITMFLTKQCKNKKFMKYRKNAKSILKHTDIIGEGEMLAGGLATFAIVVLVGLACRFLSSFLQRYPAETVKPSVIYECDGSAMNAQFSTGLELLSLPKSADAEPIFTMLDSQVFIITMDLINTGFMCSNITVQENLVGRRYIHITKTCVESREKATVSVTFTLPTHHSSMQINMTGPYYIGGLRLCVRGDGAKNGSYTLDHVDFCQSFYTENETISRVSTVPISFMKKINRTEPLKQEDSKLYAGLWIPTFSGVDYSDDAYYADFGTYLRYTSSLTVIYLNSEERAYYMKNIQQPIVRKGQVIFNGLLFASLCLEIFGLSFLVFKLFIIPSIRKIRQLIEKRRQKKSETAPPSDVYETSF